MGKVKDFLLVKIGPDPRKIGPRLKFVGIMEILFAIGLSVMSVINDDLDLTLSLVSGFLFLIGMATAFSGHLFEQLAMLESRLGVNRDEKIKK